jgi:haloalkane dehalogenase
LVEFPDWIAALLPSGVRREEVATRGERMHALVWGPPDGRTIVCVHGNPTWSFLWRRVVGELRGREGGERLKIVVPDLVGLGCSTKPAMSEHTLARHAAWLGDALDALAPGPLVLVGQDWGGPIGLRAMCDRAARLRGLVLGNTAVGPPAKNFRATAFHRLSQAPVISDLVFRVLGFPLRSLHAVQGDRASIRGEVARAYRWPLRRLRDRAAPLGLARMVPDSHAHPSIPELAACEQLYREARVPVALVWGERDPILGRILNHAARLRPDAHVTRTSAGHFLQEEVPAALADAIVDVAGRAEWS